MDHLTVSALNRYVKLLLETNDVLSSMTVQGEISNLSINRFSGHIYFSLKDESASVRAVCFKNAADRLRFIPKEGMSVLAFGRVSLFERDGQYQLIVEEILPQGAGAQNKYLKEVRQKLEKEGLFDEERKRALPKYPKSIAVVTAAGSAALADIKNVISRRYPITKLTIFPVLVQGLQAEHSILNALSAIERVGSYDVAIIARGGGSKEDLYAFSSEAVVRAASTLTVPFISAVGHEVDAPLLDYVADVRAPTPSVAAELAVPNMADLIERSFSAYLTIRRNLGSKLDDAHFFVRSISERCGDAAQRNVEEKRECLDKTATDIYKGLSRKIYQIKTALSHLGGQLHSLSPLNVLSRGYSYVEAGRRHIGSVTDIEVGGELEISFIDGSVGCRVESIDKKDLYNG